MNPSCPPGQRTGIHLGGWFQTCLQQAGAALPPRPGGYHPALAGAPPEEGNWNHLGGLFQTCLQQAGAALPRLG